MESTIFLNANKDERLLILNLLREQKLVAYLTFHPHAHEYFQEKYSEAYKYHLLNADKEFSFASAITKVDFAKSVITVARLEHYRSDAESYDDSCYVLFTTPANPKGIYMDIPIHLVSGASIQKTKLETNQIEV